MKKIKDLNKNGICMLTFASILLMVSITGCNKFMDIPLPTTQTAASGAFLTNNSTGSVLSGIFYNMANSFYAGSSGIGYQTGLYSDELADIGPNSGSPAFYTDNLTSTSTSWSSYYSQIDACNVAIEGINSATAVLSSKNQFLGEAYVTRAFTYFNLVNLFGGVPLAITSDYKVNNVLARSTVAQVYAQIISDATTAQSLLPADYRDGTALSVTTRVRPNKYAAEALLARAYLYTGDWINAEKWATDIINNTTLFKLTAPSQTFTITNNTELIWGLLPTGANFVADYSLYNNGMPAIIAANSGKTVTSYTGISLSSGQLSAFEANDARFTNWVRSTLDQNSNTTYYFPNKYKAATNGVEDIVLMRLAEIYLIRAEARAQQNNTSGAQSDINTIRTRAGLANTTAATQTALLAAVAQERRVELFTELGHRFYDLKRTGQIDAVMNVIAPLKGGTWASYKQLWPIYANDIIIDPSIVQNPGYH